MADGCKEPRNLIKREDVAIALRNDKGPDAKLDSFKVEDFMSKGDNYACVITSIIVAYTLNGKPNKTSYVVKLNPRLPEGLLSTLMTPIFKRETGFYKQMLPELNKLLNASNEPPLKVAKYFHSVEKHKEQVIFLEDLRTSGFKMHDRMLAIDNAHANLILKELARYHASSYILFDRIKNITKIYEQFPCTETDEKMYEKTVGDIWPERIAAFAVLVDLIPNYDHVSEYIRSIIQTVKKDLKIQKTAKRPFFVLTHGDCWNNNFLFRYSPVGVPLECRLVDLQAIRIGSPALDLNQVLYTSLAGKTRRNELPTFLTNYYATFASVLAGAGVPMKFSLPQLKMEFHSKNYIGFIYALLIVPITLLKPEEAPKLSDFFGDENLGAREAYRKKINELTVKSPSLRPRLLDMFDEMQEYGLFKTSSVSKLIRSFSRD